MHADPVQDAINHFIGEFALAVEDARARTEYAGEGIARPALTHKSEAANLSGAVDARQGLEGYAPGGLAALAAGPATEGGAPALVAFAAPLPLPAMTGPVGLPASFAAAPGLAPRPDLVIAPPPLPGSVALVALQENLLSDRDALFSEPLPAGLVPPGFGLGPLLGWADALDPVAALAPALPETGAALPAEAARLVGGVAELAARFAPPAPAPAPASGGPGGPELPPELPPEPARFVAEAEGLALHLAVLPGAAGVFVNGTAAEELPQIAPERLSPPEAPPDPATAPPPDPSARPEGEEAAGSEFEPELGPEPEPEPEPAAPEADPAHTLATGQNVLLNEVVLSARWVDAPAYAVAGDSISIAMIAQTALLRDADTGGPAPAPASGPALGPSADPGPIVNAAAFPLADPAAAIAPAGGPFPQDWAVATLQGDLVLFNWIAQTNFVIEHDVASLVLEGQESWVMLGANLAQNALASSVFGYGYDLIVIDGDFLRLSVISQTNVLLDDDVLAPAPGIMAAESAGNLLWNGAEIAQGGADQVIPLGGAWASLSAAFAEGDGTLPDAVLSDPVFAGEAALSVLHITGSMIAVDMVSQTNVLGDADLVSARLSEAAGAEGAELSISAGGNTLANLARIEAAGAESTIHAGGEIYSDALLYQASLIDTGAAPGAPDALVNEAVAFLAEGMLGEAAEGEESIAGSTGLAGDAAPQGLDAMMA